MLPLFPSTQPAGSVLKCAEDEPMSTMVQEVNNNQQIVENRQIFNMKHEEMNNMTIDTLALDLSKAWLIDWFIDYVSLLATVTRS